jgi:two-component system sensor histidine kinase PilS (NtrC family)
MAAVGELSAAIAHEIRHPLATICGSIDMLSGELELAGEHEILMELITKEATRLDNIITDFLEYARLRRPTFSPVDITRCIKEIVMLLDHSPAADDSLTIRLGSTAQDLRICADDEQIRQVFLNLGMNACEAMEGCGELTISIECVDAQFDEHDTRMECVRVDFANSGPPIPDDVLPHIFEPFYTTKSGGTGLGLSIAARIVESHGGCIEVDRSADEMTVFSVVIPVYVANGVRTEEIAAEELVEV